MKKIVSLFCVITLIFSLFCTITVSAADSATLTVNKSSVTVGDTVTATLTLKTDDAQGMMSYGGVINYTSSILEFQSSSVTTGGGAGVLTLAEAAGGAKSKTITFTFKATKTGSATISGADLVYVNSSVNKVGFSSPSKTVSVKDKTLSSNNNLNSITPHSGVLTPKFSPSVTEYTINVSNSVEECKISATKQDSSATYIIEGSAKLKVGKNVRTIVVTAANGNIKKYTITINRSDTADTNSTTSEDSSLQTEINGNKFSIATDISSVELFDGFEKTTVDYNGKEIPVASDKNFTFYYLAQEGNDAFLPFMFDEETKTFSKVNFLVENNTKYIVTDIPDDKKFSDDYYSTSANIGDFSVKALTSSDLKLSDFYYIYCYKKGEYGFYRYDSLEGSLQRFPELSLTETNNEQLEDSKNQNSFLVKFKSLTKNSKIIIVSLVFVLILMISLIVLFVIKLFNSNDIDITDDRSNLNETFDTTEYILNDNTQSEDNTTDNN